MSQSGLKLILMECYFRKNPTDYIGIFLILQKENQFMLVDVY